MTVSSILPPAGWSEPDTRGHITFVRHGRSSMLSSPEHPKREGFECYFVARHGTYTRWTYKPVQS